MSGRGIPPFPYGGDWRAWATQLVEFLQDRDPSLEENLASPVSLSHLRPEDRAVEPGTLMYDAQAVNPVFSDGAAWVALSSGGGTTTFTGLTDTPASHVGSQYFIPEVNGAETALEYRKQGVSDHRADRGYVFDDLVAFEGTVYHCILDVPEPGLPFSLTNFAPIAGVTGSGSTFEYRWSTVTSGAPPSGHFGITDAIDNPTNTVRISDTTDDNRDITAFLSSAHTGDYISFVEDTGGAESVLFIISGATVDMGGYFEIPVDWVTNTGEPENNRKGFVFLVDDPNARLPAGGTSGQHLAKDSAADYDTSWTDPFTQTEGDALYLQLTGGVMTGRLDARDNIVAIRLGRITSVWDVGVHDANNYVRFYDATNAVVAARIDAVGVAALNTATVITREKGDARYAPIALATAVTTEVDDLKIILNDIVALLPGSSAAKALITTKIAALTV